MVLRNEATMNGHHRPRGQANGSNGTNGVNGSDSNTKPVRPAQHRKQSSPMAPAFMVSAPGKVIVFGEHAVVHGKAAMAAAISLRSYLLVTTLSKSQRTVRLVFPDVGLDHTWDIDSLPWEVFAKNQKKPKYYDLVTSLDEELMEALRPSAEEISHDVPTDMRKVHLSAASCFLYLFLCLSNPSMCGFIYTLRSTIPVGAGLGSSASISVCISAALLKQIHVLSGPHQDQPTDEVETQLERINRWAFVGEMCIHGNPSGIDNTVSTKGKAVLFKRKDYAKPPVATLLRDFPELPLLLINTCQSRSTATEVAKVSARRRKYPEVTETTLNSIDSVTMSAHRLITSEDFDPELESNVEHLGDLFRINHGLLVSLDVSHPKLEHIREMVDYAGIGWTKLTGAGGGGCAITLLRRDIERQALVDLQKNLQKAGFKEYKTTLGGDGVGILYPAVLQNGTDEKGGDEIDHEKFMNAQNEDDLERLVGVGRLEKRPEWKFWRL